MSLLDHFRPPLSERRHWHAFHNSWATYLSSQLNESLPPGYFAEANVQHDIEIDVAALDEGTPAPFVPGWVPPAPRTVPLTLAFPLVEIAVFSRSGGPTLAGAVELLSPANKDRPATRDAFVAKCASYLQAGVGLVIVDVVTERPGDLDRELLAHLRVTPPDDPSPLYACAYRPVRIEEAVSLQLWREPLALGRPLPTLPLWLRGGICLPLDLQSAYERTCREQRIAPAA
ncbi:MAG: DUF4058 family protein [Gemmataceae bacterium]|nr:DUF4058 family protein [Gemmataceae bacterium]